MRFLNLISPLLASIAALSTTALAASEAVKPATAPKFDTIMLATFDIGQVGMTQGPLGTRLFDGVIGANITDTKGRPIADLVGNSADTGIITASGIFYPQVVTTIRWRVDKKLAYMRLRGVGVYPVSDLTYVHFETDSPTYSHLNSRFLLANVTFPTDPNGNPVLTIFEAR